MIPGRRSYTEYIEVSDLGPKFGGEAAPVSLWWLLDRATPLSLLLQRSNNMAKHLPSLLPPPSLQVHRCPWPCASKKGLGVTVQIAAIHEEVPHRLVKRLKSPSQPPLRIHTNVLVNKPFPPRLEKAIEGSARLPGTRDRAEDPVRDYGVDGPGLETTAFKCCGIFHPTRWIQPVSPPGALSMQSDSIGGHGGGAHE
jgi:hypothetical protein